MKARRRADNPCGAIFVACGPTILQVVGRPRQQHRQEGSYGAEWPCYGVVCPDLVGQGRGDRLHDPDGYARPEYMVDMIMLIAAAGRHFARRLHWPDHGRDSGLTDPPSSDQRSRIVRALGGLRRIGGHLRSRPRGSQLWTQRTHTLATLSPPSARQPTLNSGIPPSKA
jgi:hypothetical protein